jgi:hypothetical protein
MSRTAAAVVDQLETDCVYGLYQCGSPVIARLGADSDIDLPLATRQALTAPERQGLLGSLLKASGAQASTPGRPFELTSIVLADVVSHR